MDIYSLFLIGILLRFTYIFNESTFYGFPLLFLLKTVNGRSVCSMASAWNILPIKSLANNMYWIMDNQRDTLTALPFVVM